MKIKVFQISRHGKDNDVINAIMSTNFEHYFYQIPEPLYNWFFWKYITTKIKALLEISKVKPDILIIHEFQGFPFGLFLLLISKILKIKTIMQFELPKEAFPSKNDNLIELIIKLARLPFIILTAKLADRLQVFTEWEVEIISKFTDVKKTRVIPYGTDFDIGTLPKENYIFTVARWSDRKNLHTILCVFKEVCKRIDNIHLIIGGEFYKGRYYIPEEGRWETGDEYRNNIMRLVHNLKIEDKIIFLDFVPNEKLKELYRKAKIFYLPSKMETFGRVYVEAMASGTPIVAMKNSAVQYVVKDGVTGFLRNTKEGQKEAILELLTNKKLYRQMQKNCLKEAEKYRWVNVIKEWEKLIRELVDGERK
jgi:glycosyltransferase involved in cell wall biosynthesis